MDCWRRSRMMALCSGTSTLAGPPVCAWARGTLPTTPRPSSSNNANRGANLVHFLIDMVSLFVPSLLGEQLRCPCQPGVDPCGNRLQVGLRAAGFDPIAQGLEIG